MSPVSCLPAAVTHLSATVWVLVAVKASPRSVWDANVTLIKQNIFPTARTKHQLGAARATSTVLASLWINNMEIAVDMEIFTPVKK